MIILISGRMGSGKSRMASELAKVIPNSCIVKFADPLYAIHNATLETLRSYGMDIQGINRDLLQDVGLWGRKQHPDFWVRIMRGKLNKLMLNNPTAVAIADDLRYKNEFNAFGDAFTIRLKASEECRKSRAQKWGNSQHESETALDDLEDNLFNVCLDSENNSVEHNVNIVLKAIEQWKNGKQ